ncbi:MAG TPA: sigma-70 family RNA polymerase sigma factor [Ktedonobacterales bacterium]|nr:sigma-70 family RNA polymerase sigma factor [Ktedonobacterales bacterium]
MSRWQAERTVRPFSYGQATVAIPMGVAPEGVALVVDRELFLALVERHTAVLLKATSALVGFTDAEDAAQEAVLRAWRKRETLRDPAAFRPWLLQIAVNVCREWQRGGYGKHLRANLPLTADHADLLGTLDADPGDSGFALALDLRQAINELAPELRMAVVLRYYAGMDASEIGAALGVPPPTIRTRLRRALTLLRERLRDSGHLPVTERNEGGTHV